MRILALSDLHLAHLPFSPVHEGRRIDEDADVVVLAGDIHPGVGGIIWASKTFCDKSIMYVAGNHKLYGKDFDLGMDAQCKAEFYKL